MKKIPIIDCTRFGTTILELATKIKEVNPIISIQFKHPQNFYITKKICPYLKKILGDLNSLTTLYIS